MDIFDEWINKLRGFDLWDIVINILYKHRDRIIEFNKIQLASGKNTLDQDISPDYFSDPFFKSAAHSQAYAKWKDKLENPFEQSKGFRIPDFYITGRMVYDTLNAKIVGDEIIIEPSDRDAKSFDSKWKNIYGVSDAHIELLLKQIMPEVYKEMNKYFKTKG